MMPRHAKILAALYLAGAAALALGGCKEKPAQKQAAGGELLPRSVTDDMPPYDTVRSQPPLASPEAAATSAPGRPHPAADASEAAAAAEEAASEVHAVEAAEPGAGEDAR
ncbi:MAG TPA: hypothetical protein VJQ77_03695 [Novosphingobium sp.]|nr:hypothetical protein [Novosphingobium sp.]